MVLRCECGGVLELTGQSYTENSAFEYYECVNCGQSGSYTFDETLGERTSGCVEVA